MSSKTLGLQKELNLDLSNKSMKSFNDLLIQNNKFLKNGTLDESTKAM